MVTQFYTHMNTNMTDAEKVRKIKHDWQMYKLSEEEARKGAAPLLEKINKKAQNIAKRFGQKPRVFTFENI